MKHLLISNDGKLGDAIVNSTFVTGAKTLDNNLRIHVLASGTTVKYWSSLNEIEKVWDLSNTSVINHFKIIRNLRKEHYDSIVTFKEYFTNEKTKLLLHFSNAGKVIYYPKNKIPEHASIKSLKAINEIYSRKIDIKKTKYLLNQNKFRNSNIILLNLFSADANPERTINIEESSALISKLNETLSDFEIRLLCTNETLDFINILKTNKALKFTIANTFSEYNSLMINCAEASLIISPCTSVTHIASALNIPVIGIYRKDGIQDVEWEPTSTVYHKIYSKYDNSIRGFSIDEIVHWCAIFLNFKIQS